MTKCVKPVINLATRSTMSSRSTHIVIDCVEHGIRCKGDDGLVEQNKVGPADWQNSPVRPSDSQNSLMSACQMGMGAGEGASVPRAPRYYSRL
jgi:hypothetical protein